MKMTSLFTASPRATAVQDLTSARMKSERLERHLRLGGVVMGIFSLVLTGGVIRFAPAYLPGVTLVLAGLCCMMAFALHHVHMLVQELLVMEARVRMVSARSTQRPHLTEAGVHSSQPSLTPHAPQPMSLSKLQSLSAPGGVERQTSSGLRRCISKQPVLGSASHATLSVEDPHFTRIYLG